MLTICFASRIAKTLAIATIFFTVTHQTMISFSLFRRFVPVACSGAVLLIAGIAATPFGVSEATAVALPSALPFGASVATAVALPATTRPGAPAVPAASPQARDTIRWEPFVLPAGTKDLTAQLGRLRVPQVRSSTGSSASFIDLAFVRLQSTKRAEGAPLVYLEGGPGQDAISAARFAPALASFARIAKNRDVILLDQRGTGLSTPRPVCIPKAPLAPGERFDANTAPEARLAAAIGRVKACVAEWVEKGGDARAFTNRESAADVESIRVALGASKMSLYGFSYGTHLALVTLRDYPSSIERIVLVGTAGPDDLRKLPSISDVQFAKLSLMVAESPAIGREVPDMAALFQRVLAKLDKTPTAVTVFDRSRKADVTVTIGSDALRSIIMQDLGDGNDIPVFPALLLTIERGDPSILAWFLEKRYNELSGAVSIMPYGMRCSSGATPELERKRVTEILSSPFRNSMNQSFPGVCAAFPPLDGDDRYRAPLISDVPILFISGTLDNHTPPYQAEKLRWGMPNARHIIVQNAGHEDLLPMSGVQDAIVDWLQGTDVGDRKIALPSPRFLSVDDAKKDRVRAGK